MEENILKIVDNDNASRGGPVLKISSTMRDIAMGALRGFNDRMDVDETDIAVAFMDLGYRAGLLAAKGRIG